MQCSRSLRRLLASPQISYVPTRSSRRCLHASRSLCAEKDNAKELRAAYEKLSIGTAQVPATTESKPKEVVWKQARKRKDRVIPNEDDLSVSRGLRKRKASKASARRLKPYTEEELERLESFYSPQQMAAIRAGESGIDRQDLIRQASLQQGQMTLNYLDDFSDHRPVIDRNPEQPSLRDPKTGKMPRLRWKEEDELVDDLEDWLDAQPADGGESINFDKFLVDHKPYVSEADPMLAPTSLAPELEPIDDPLMKAQARAAKQSATEKDEMTEEYYKLAKQLGIDKDIIRKYKIKFLVTRRVSNQTRLGKRQQTYFLTIAGNGNGLLGLGEAKSQEASDARKKAITDAIRNMVPIRRYEGRTIFGNIKAKSGATELELYARHPGFGARCSELIWEMCKAAGITDISARVTRSRNPMNIVKATFTALTNQPDPEEIAIARGKRMVDLRKVYYAGGNA